MEKERRKQKQDKLYKYGQLILNAQLECKAKALLYFYAHTFNWVKGVPTFYGQDKICAYVGMSPKTYQKTRRYLENLGWIEYKYRGYSKSVLVWVLEGIDDPNFKNKSYAEGHPDLIKLDKGIVDARKLTGFDPFSPNSRNQIPL